MIARCEAKDFSHIYEIINDGATAYKGVIPADRLHEPYMTTGELKTQIDAGVQFWGYWEEDRLTGVMGIQFKGDVTLIRHAYVRTSNRNKGIGSKLLNHLRAISATPVLIGTWADATWAIQFYQKHGFRLVEKEEKDRLLGKYWTIPARQVETSVVLASANWQSNLKVTITEVKEPLLDTLKETGVITYIEHFADIWTKEGLENYLAMQFKKETLLNELNSSYIKYFIAYRNNSPIGLIKVKLNQLMPTAFTDKGMELEKIYLLKQFTGKGTGAVLMDFVVQYGIKNKEPFIWLDVLKSNTSAINFYKRYGFTITGELDFSTDKMKIDMWVMKKALLQS